MSAVRPRRPVLLTFAIGYCLFTGLVLVLMLVAAARNAGRFSLNDEIVSGPEFLRRAGVSWGLAAAFFLAIGIGLWRNRAWARPLMILFWILPVIGVVTVGTRGDFVRAVGSMVVMSALFAWAAWAYLYRVRSVNAYFESLKVTNTLPR